MKNPMEPMDFSLPHRTDEENVTAPYVSPDVRGLHFVETFDGEASPLGKHMEELVGFGWLIDATYKW